MPLDPDVEKLLAQLDAAGAPPLHTLPVNVARELAGGFTAFGAPMAEVHEVEDRTLPTASGGVPVRLYRPSADRDLPCLVYLHGSGWMYGDLEMSDTLCRRLANGSGCVVCSLDYPLAPERPFPAALDDTLDALRWLAEHGAEIGIDPGRIAIGGESSGANIAAAACLAARDAGGPTIAFQLLVCPPTDHACDTASHEQFADGYVLTRDTMKWLWTLYVGPDGDAAAPYASPLRADDLSGLPTALVVTAEYDPLRDEGEAYANRLAEAGVDVETRRYPGHIHGLLTFAGAVPSGLDAIDDCAQALRARLAQQPSEVGR